MKRGLVCRELIHASAVIGGLALVGCGGQGQKDAAAPAAGEIAEFIADNPEFADAADDNVEQLNSD